MFWIFWCTWTLASGWILSVVRQVTLLGYLLSYLAFAACVWRFHRRLFGVFTPPSVHWRYRFQRFLPRCFLLISVFALLGGLLNYGNNVDYLAYRLPRMLHWAIERGWYWIATPDIRLNLSAQGMEWLMMPLMLVTRSDRLFFVLNYVSYLLLPSLTYRFLIDLGIRKKVAWQWMWLFPACYCYVLQAGGLGNDAIAAPFFLLSAIFGLEARRSRSFRYLAFSLLAAGLLSSIKASNTPLLLPLCLIWLVNWPLVRQRPASVFGILMVLAVCSVFPTLALNTKYTGSWIGDPTNSLELKLANPVACFVGNNLQLLQTALHFPVFPLASAWNSHVLGPALATGAGRWLLQRFPRIQLQLSDFEWEEPAGIGFSIGLLLVVLIVLGAAARARGKVRSGANTAYWLVAVGGLTAYAYYCVSLGSEQAGRLLAPYYPALLVIVLWWTGMAHPVQQPWWKWLVRAVMILPIFLVIIYPGHPVLELTRIVDRLPLPGNQRLRILVDGSYYRHAVLANGLKSVQEHIPAGVRRVGLVGYDAYTKVSLWRPFGSREVIEIYDPRNPVNLPDLVVVCRPGLEPMVASTVEQWAEPLGLQKVFRCDVTLDDRIGPQEWIILKRSP